MGGPDQAGASGPHANVGEPTEKLAESGETSAAARRHFDFYLNLAANAEAQLYGPDQEVWFDRLEVEHDNIAAALSWSLSASHAADGLRLATALGFFWDLRAHYHEAYGWFRMLLDSDDRAPAAVRTKAVCSAGPFASYLGRSAEAAALCEEALAGARHDGDELNIAWSLTNLILTRPVRTIDDLRQAVTLLGEGLALFRARGDGWGMSHALRHLGWALTVAGEYERAATFLEEALALARSAQNTDATAWSLFLLGKVVWLLTRDARRTRVLYEESLSFARQTRNLHLLQQALFMLGQVAYSQKNYVEARSRYREVVALAQETGAAAHPDWFLKPVVLGFAQLAVTSGESEQAAKLLGAAHEVLAASQHIFAIRIDLAEGQRLSVAQAISYALQGEGVESSLA